MTSARATLRGFTLLELLIATSLLISVVTIATIALNQMLHMVRRLQALQDMNSAAALVHNRLTRQVSSMHPCTALWLSQKASDNSVELVFMHGVEITGTPRFNTDQRWTRWHWSKATGVLRISEGRGERNFTIGQSTASGYWKFTPNSLVDSNRFMLVPQPVRDPGANGPEVLLNLNSWDTKLAFPSTVPPPAGDFGDYADLEYNAIPVLQNCIACTIQIVDLDGNTHTADGSVTKVELAAPGAFVDGRPYTDSGKTASIVRLRFTLATSYLLGDISAADKDKTLVQAIYSFSASAPNDTSY